jgi:hypothetical protein
MRYIANCTFAAAQMVLGDGEPIMAELRVDTPGSPRFRHGSTR